jgi:hypothetical protein
MSGMKEYKKGLIPSSSNQPGNIMNEPLNQEVSHRILGSHNSGYGQLHLLWYNAV